MLTHKWKSTKVDGEDVPCNRLKGRLIPFVLLGLCPPSWGVRMLREFLAEAAGFYISQQFSGILMLPHVLQYKVLVVDEHMSAAPSLPP